MNGKLEEATSRSSTIQNAPSAEKTAFEGVHEGVGRSEVCGLDGTHYTSPLDAESRPHSLLHKIRSGVLGLCRALSCIS